MSDIRTVPLDTISAGVVLSTLLGILPAIAALFSALWFGIQIYESKTVQAWIHAHRVKVRGRKLARLKAREVVILAEIDALEKVRIAKAYADEKVLEAKADASRGMVLQATAEKVDDALSDTLPLSGL